jgi:putative transposase
MDGKGRCLDNVFVERLWRSLKSEEVYLHVYDDVAEARAGIGRYLAFFNDERVNLLAERRHPTRSWPRWCRPRGQRRIPTR